MQENVSILTERQRQAYLLRQQGMTYRKIGEEMGISDGAASRLVRDAQRRLQNHEQFCRWQEKQNQPVDFPLTRGELALLLTGAREMRIDMMRSAMRKKDGDLASRLPDEYPMLEQLILRVEQALK